MLGGRRFRLEQFTGRSIPEFIPAGNGIHDLNQWISSCYRPVFDQPGVFEFAIESAFLQAQQDGIRRLEMSIDITIGTLFRISPDQVIDTIKRSHQNIAPGIDFSLDLGIPRSLNIRETRSYLESYLQTGYVEGIDLYDDELAQPAGNYTGIYREARNAGLRRKAHAGEFGTAEDVRETVELLDLDAVQHGIAAAGSVEIMKWLADRRIPLHICPTSNILLGIVPSYQTHPVKLMYDHGVRVTINTDDVLIFDQGVSEEFLNLYRAGLFSAFELNEIREYSLRKPSDYEFT